MGWSPMDGVIDLIYKDPRELPALSPWTTQREATIYGQEAAVTSMASVTP
jgi:hypothetical protein